MENNDILIRIKRGFEAFLNSKYFLPGANYAEDGLVTSHVRHFMEDKKFIKARNISLDHPCLKNHRSKNWRMYIACCVVSIAKKLDGDFVECGVDRSTLSRAIVEYIDFNILNKNFYLLDTWEGIPIEMMSEQEKKINPPFKRNYGDMYEIVKERFKNFHNVFLIKGKIPDTLKKIKSEKIAYLSIDMNNVTPEIASIEFFLDKITPGGLVLLEDYAYGKKYRFQRESFDEFASSKNREILNIPTGQGILIK